MSHVNLNGLTLADILAKSSMALLRVILRGNKVNVKDCIV